MVSLVEILVLANQHLQVLTCLFSAAPADGPGPLPETAPRRTAPLQRPGLSSLVTPGCSKQLLWVHMSPAIPLDLSVPAAPGSELHP